MNPMSVKVDQDNSRLCFETSADRARIYILEEIIFDQTGKAVRFVGYYTQDGLKRQIGVNADQLTWMGDAL